MQRRITLAVSSLVLTLVVCTISTAADYWHRFSTDWHRNNCWPKPFNYSDRDAVRVPFFTMVNNGWQRQTTLGDYHFDGGSQELNQAGRRQLRWILTQAPENRRIVFVQRSTFVDQTAARVDSVQRSAATIIPRGLLPEVVQTHSPPIGMPAELIDPVYRLHASTIPEPRLPERGGSTFDQ